MHSDRTPSKYQSKSARGQGEMAEVGPPVRVFEDTMQSDLAYLIGQIENKDDV